MFPKKCTMFCKDCIKLRICGLIQHLARIFLHVIQFLTLPGKYSVNPV